MINIKEVKAYLRDRSDYTDNLINELIPVVKRTARPLMSYGSFPLLINDDELIINGEVISSNDLRKFLMNNDDSVIIMAVSLGSSIDLLIKRELRINPLRGLVIDAIASSFVDGICDELELRINNEFNYDNTKRYSPGYGDLGLEYNKLFINMLGIKWLSVTNSYMLIPQKSVIAVIGLRNNGDGY